MILGLCGTHGTGKSTILQGVKSAGFPVVEAQLSRTAQKSLGWSSLSNAEQSVENMWALQDAIINAMYDRDCLISKSKQFTLVERTPADVWAYTELWCSRLGLNPLTDYKAKAFKRACRQLAGDFYSMFLMVPIKDEVPFQYDPHRADEKSRQTVADSISGFIWDGGLPYSAIESTSPQARVSEAIAQITLLKMKDTPNV